MTKETVKLSALKNNEKNPRYIRDDKFKKLVKSLQDFPQMLQARPLVVNTEYEVLGGNMRLEALKKAGVKETEVVVVDWTEDKQKEFIAKDNINYGEWDWDMLNNEWETGDLIDWGIDGFNFGTAPEFIEIPETDLGNNSGNKEHKVTDVGFVKFDVVMREEHKDFLILLLNEIKKVANITLGDALYFMAKKYNETKEQK